MSFWRAVYFISRRRKAIERWQRKWISGRGIWVLPRRIPRHLRGWAVHQRFMQKDVGLLNWASRECNVAYSEALRKLMRFSLKIGRKFLSSPWYWIELLVVIFFTQLNLVFKLKMIRQSNNGLCARFIPKEPAQIFDYEPKALKWCD